MHNFTPYSALLGGAVIGLASALFLLSLGRVCGVSGLFGGLLRRGADIPWQRAAFVGGLVVGGALLRLVYPHAFAARETIATAATAATQALPWLSALPPWAIVVPAGLLVGFGTQLGNGCTSGHGICGISRLAPRSMVATASFMAAGFATVFVVRHVLGGAS